MVWALIFFLVTGEDQRPVRLGDFVHKENCELTAKAIESDRKWSRWKPSARPFLRCIRVRPNPT